MLHLDQSLNCLLSHPSSFSLLFEGVFSYSDTRNDSRFVNEWSSKSSKSISFLTFREFFSSSLLSSKNSFFGEFGYFFGFFDFFIFSFFNCFWIFGGYKLSNSVSERSDKFMFSESSSLL